MNPYDRYDADGPGEEIIRWVLKGTFLILVGFALGELIGCDSRDPMEAMAERTEERSRAACAVLCEKTGGSVVRYESFPDGLSCTCGTWVPVASEGTEL